MTLSVTVSAINLSILDFKDGNNELVVSASFSYKSIHIGF